MEIPVNNRSRISEKEGNLEEVNSLNSSFDHKGQLVGVRIPLLSTYLVVHIKYGSRTGAPVNAQIDG